MVVDESDVGVAGRVVAAVAAAVVATWLAVAAVVVPGFAAQADKANAVIIANTPNQIRFCRMQNPPEMTLIRLYPCPYRFGNNLCPEDCPTTSRRKICSHYNGRIDKKAKSTAQRRRMRAV